MLCTAMNEQPGDGSGDGDSDNPGIPPQPVVYECRRDGCTLEHHAMVDNWLEVQDVVAYYSEQGHQAQARFPVSDDSTWSLEEHHTRANRDALPPGDGEQDDEDTAPGDA